MKDLSDLLFRQMQKLDKNQIDCETARAQAGLGRQVNNVRRITVQENNTRLRIRQFNVANDADVKYKE